MLQTADMPYLGTVLMAGSSAFVSTVLLVKVLVDVNLPFPLPLDCPNERSLHTKPVPRCGGVAVMGGVLRPATYIVHSFTTGTTTW